MIYVRQSGEITLLWIPEAECKEAPEANECYKPFHLIVKMYWKVAAFDWAEVNRVIWKLCWCDDAVRWCHSLAANKTELVHPQTHLFPLGYWTTISWSSSMPHTVPVVVSVSNMPSVHPPWPCWRDWTISRSKSMLTRSPIWSPPGFLLPFCSPRRS